MELSDGGGAVDQAVAIGERRQERDLVRGLGNR